MDNFKIDGVHVLMATCGKEFVFRVNDRTGKVERYDFNIYKNNTGKIHMHKDAESYDWNGAIKYALTSHNPSLWYETQEQKDMKELYKQIRERSKKNLNRD